MNKNDYDSIIERAKEIQKEWRTVPAPKRGAGAGLQVVQKPLTSAYAASIGSTETVPTGFFKTITTKSKHPLKANPLQFNIHSTRILRHSRQETYKKHSKII